MEATCGECGTVYRGKAIGGLESAGWERRDGVLCDLRWCLCQRGRMGRDVVTGSIVLPHPEYGDNTVLFSLPFARRHTIITIDRATAAFYFTKDGGKYRRRDGFSPGSGYDRSSIAHSELPRLEAWAAKGGGK